MRIVKILEQTIQLRLILQRQNDPGVDVQAGVRHERGGGIPDLQRYMPRQGLGAVRIVSDVAGIGSRK